MPIPAQHAAAPPSAAAILHLVATLAIAACGRPVPEPELSAPPARGERRAIVISLDAFNEARVRSSLPREAIPTISALFDGGVCAASARPAFPSVTAAGHASLWTGAYGDVNGISANTVPQLPRDQHTILDVVSGFQSTQLRAEPIWVTAALSGMRVAGHHATQSPGIPGFPSITSTKPDPVMDSLRARATAAARSPLMHLVNGYDVKLVPEMLVDATRAPVRDAPRWRGLERMHPDVAGDGSVASREATVPVGIAGDSLFLLFTGTNARYTHLLASGSRDAGAAVVVRPHPVETALPTGRPLARRFSAPLKLVIGGRTVRTHLRLFELAGDASRYMLYLPPIALLASNHASTAEEYARATRWVGNSAGRLLGSGAFGPVLASDGDGTAERRWLETAELMTRESIAGVRWMWSALQPQLLLDYFALGDDTDHTFWGLVARSVPGHDAGLAHRVQEIRERAWSLVDLRVRAVAELAADAGAPLFLSGDHGMRPSWRTFRPNVALANAGLLVHDTSGGIDLARTRAAAPNGYWVTVNRAAWRGGIVAPVNERAVIDSVARALRAVRDDEGQAVVSRTYVASRHDSLGIGGPSGGDVYFELAPGYYYDGAATGPVIAATDAVGTHGYPSTSPDMHTALCASGGPFAPRRLGVVRTIDLAPTVLAWLGLQPPVTMRGRSLLAEMLSGR